MVSPASPLTLHPEANASAISSMRAQQATYSSPLSNKILVSTHTTEINERNPDVCVGALGVLPRKSRCKRLKGCKHVQRETIETAGKN
jgi:hypothetical protein